jgi:preprotein translocase subunit Sec61beta
MDLDDSDKVIIEEARRSHKISVDSIISYDAKIHQIVILSTLILSAVFTIVGFFSLEYTIEKITSKIVLYFGFFISWVLIIICLIIALILCLKTYTISEYNTIRPLSLWQGLSSYTQTQKNNFMNELIEEIDYNTNENSEISNTLWDNYTKAIAFLACGIALMVLFILFAILIKIGI